MGVPDERKTADAMIEARLAPAPPPARDDLYEFLLVLRQALLMIVVWIERRYHLRGPRGR